jgi:ABC-type multidrug transport system fused ATPase/permease subunit
MGGFPNGDAPAGASTNGSGTARGGPARRRVGPNVVVDVWRYLGVFLGRQRRRKLLLQPLVAGVLALAEVVVLLSLIRLLLLIVEQEDRTSIGLLGRELSFSFAGLAWLALAASAVSIVARIAEARFVARMAAHAVTAARSAVLRNWFRADWQHMRQARLGQLQQLLGLNAHHVMVPVNLFALGSLAVMSLVMYAVIVAIVAPLVALLFIAISAGVAACFGPVRGRVRRAAKSTSRAVSELQLTATSYAQLNRELHAYGVSDAASRRLDELNDGVRVSFERVRMLTRLVPGLFQQVLLSSVVIVVLLARVLDVDAHTFGTAAILAVRALSYVQQLSSNVHTFMESRPFLEELTDASREHRALRRSQGSERLGGIERLELRDVSFSYDGTSPALSNVTLSLEPGDWLGVVGRSGGGKTTLANILVGLLTPSGGDYLVNGRPASEYRNDDWARSFALLSQEPTLLRATVADNIAFHRPVEGDAVVRSASRAHVTEEIERLPDGFASFVGDGYSTMSGGQRQRVALARALFDDPACLVLDEPTSALDARNAQLLEASLADLPPSAIVVVISHRLSLLSRCSRFVRIEGGTVVARGTAAEVGLTSLVEDDREEPAEAARDLPPPG